MFLFLANFLKISLQPQNYFATCFSMGHNLNYQISVWLYLIIFGFSINLLSLYSIFSQGISTWNMIFAALKITNCSVPGSHYFQFSYVRQILMTLYQVSALFLILDHHDPETVWDSVCLESILSFLSNFSNHGSFCTSNEIKFSDLSFSNKLFIRISKSISLC